MKLYTVDCEIHWGQAYTIEAETEQEAIEKAENQFLIDYGLENNYNVGLLGIGIECEEIEPD